MRTQSYKPRAIDILVISLLLLCVSGSSFGRTAGLASADTGMALAASTDSMYFPETGHTVGGRFLNYWQENGGLPQQGYPISDELQEQSSTDGHVYTMQYFERAVFEAHPENSAPNDVLLSLLGVFQYKLEYPNGAPNAVASAESNAVTFPETGMTLGGRFLDYWQAHGGLRQQGYPISNEFSEVSPINGISYTVQYFERAEFEYHPENEGTPYEVLLSQLGKFQYDRRNSQPLPTSTPTTAVPPTATSIFTPVPIPSDVSQWIHDNAVQFDTTDPVNDNTDLGFLKAAVGDARVVELGEATHSTHEFQTLKQRIVEYLVEEMGFTTFAIEDDWASDTTVNDYVRSNLGNPRGAISNMTQYFWKTQEVLDLINWMHDYNQTLDAGSKVAFAGVDMQMPSKAIDKTQAYLRKVDEAKADEASSLYSCFSRYESDLFSYKALPTETKTACRSNLQEVYDNLVGNQSQYEAKTSHTQFAYALHSADIVLQAEDCYANEGCLNRDKSMAENVEWLLEEGGSTSKVIVWAHNGHVATYKEPEYNWQSMGQYLRDKYGTGLVVFGLDFYRGGFNAFPLQPPVKMTAFQADPPPANSYEYYLGGANLPRLFLDLGAVPQNKPETSWLTGTHLMRSIGAGYDASAPENGYRDLNITEWFDGLFFIQDTSPARFLH
jgi:erythromycin esterase